MLVDITRKGKSKGSSQQLVWWCGPSLDEYSYEPHYLWNEDKVFSPIGCTFFFSFMTAT